ncbi:hypothetical protein D3C76_1390910 [compost metagenome]
MVTWLELTDTLIGTVAPLLVFLSVIPPLVTLGFSLMFRLKVITGRTLELIPVLPFEGLKVAVRAVVG